LWLRTSPIVFNMWPWIIKLDEEKLKYANFKLAQENGFIFTFLHNWLNLAKGATKLCMYLSKKNVNNVI
jgi:hypothetical protein